LLGTSKFREALRAHPLRVTHLALPCLLACAAHAEDDLKTQATPTDLRQAVALSEKLGRAIFDVDEVSAKATDTLRAGVSAEELASVRGWVAVAGPWWKIAFVVADGSAKPNKVGFEVNFPLGERPLMTRARVTRVQPPRAMDTEEARQWRAKGTAEAAVQQRCRKDMNYVVLPAALAGQRGLLVYLLASTDQAETQVWGGHQRFHLNEDGTQVLDQLRLSQCMPLVSSKGVSHYTLGTPFFDAPNEGHVFSALSNRTDLYLGTRRGIWKVDASGIAYKGPHSERRVSDAGQPGP
jgi:hypothetical protein